MRQQAQVLELARGPRREDLFEVQVEHLSPKGFGVATLHAKVGPQKEPKTYRMLIRKGVPGDVVRVRIEGKKRRDLTCGIDEILTPSPMRHEPRCAHFGSRLEEGKGCGGCTLQSLTYRHQLLTKERLVKRLMVNAGVDPGLVLPVLGVDEPWFYRNKMEYSVGDDAQKNLTVGLHPSGYKYDVLGLSECWLQSEFSSRIVPKIQSWFRAQGFPPYKARRNTGWLRTVTIREGKRTNQRMVILTTTSAEEVELEDDRGRMSAQDAAQAFAAYIEDLGVELGQPWTSIYWIEHHAKRGERTRFIPHLLHGEAALMEELHLPGDRALRFEIDPSAFFQPNTLQAEVLYAQVMDAAGLSADHQAGSVLDLYCGTGTIGLCLAPFAERVTGIELNPLAVENARKNARDNGMENIVFFAGDVGKVLGSEEFVQAAGGEVDVVVVDPPRAGLFPEARAQLKRFDAPRIVYVSCNPEALGRDLADLQTHGYVVEKIQPVDMFPHTSHIENVAVLSKS